MATPDTPTTNAGVLLLHGFPSGLVVAEHIGADLPQLADRIAQDLGWTAMSLRFRGCGQSEGNFSLLGWVQDARAAIDYLSDTVGCTEIWVCGFGTGGAVGLTAAVERCESKELTADESGMGGVALIGAPADFDDWAAEPDRLLAHARQAGAIADVDFPADMASWSQELATVRTSSVAERFGSHPLLVLHGGDDVTVPPVDARMVAEAHGSADLRLLLGSGHHLRHDPRGVAILLGWLQRQQQN